MRYFIAHLLSGDVERYYEKLSDALTLGFKTIPLHERVPAHITVKPPFDANDEGLADVERTLRAFALEEKPIQLTISNFGHFGFRTIYLDVRNANVAGLIRRAVSFLDMQVPWLPKSTKDGNKPHVSVARFLSRTQSRRIWRALKEVSLLLTTSVDNVAILKKEGKRWVLHSLIPLGGSENGFRYRPASELAESRLL